MDITEALKQCGQELAESGKLSLPARRKIWQAMGEIEPRKRDSVKPRTATQVKLRLACVILFHGNLT